MQRVRVSLRQSLRLSNPSIRSIALANAARVFSPVAAVRTGDGWNAGFERKGGGACCGPDETLRVARFCPSVDAVPVGDAKERASEEEEKERDAAHFPLSSKEVVRYSQDWRPRDYVDCTLGTGDHACAVLSAHREMETFFRLDVDPRAHAEARPTLQQIVQTRSSSASSLNLDLIHTNFRNIKTASSFHTFCRVGSRRVYWAASAKQRQFRCSWQLAGQELLQENKTSLDLGTNGGVEEKEEYFSAVDVHAINNEVLDPCHSEQEQENFDGNDLNRQNRTERESLQPEGTLSCEDLIKSELQETWEYTEASENQSLGSKAPSLNDLLHTLNSTEKSDDLYAKLRPFNGKISTQDAATVIKLLDDKRLCFSFYTWVKQQSSYTPDLTFFLTIVRFLLQTSKWEKLVFVAQDLFDAGFTLDNGMYCRIIKDASLKRKITVCEWWFQKMKEQGCWPDGRTYNTMIHAYALARLPERAFATFEEMVERDILPDINTFCHLLLACQSKGDAELAHNYFLQMGNYGLMPDLVVYSILLDTYGKLGKATEASEVFREMHKVGITPDAKAYNSLMAAYGKAGMMDQATSTFNEYQKEAGQNPDKIVFWTMLHLYAQAGLLQQALAVKKMMRVAQIPVDASCYTMLIDGFRRKEQWEDAIRAFKEMQRYKYPVDARTYEMMMKIFTKVGHHVECERTFDQLMTKGYTKKVLLYEIMINMYKRTNNLTNATRIYELAKRNGCQPNRNMCNSMIHMYAKAGMLAACEKIVREMQASRIEPNKNTFLSLIKAYAVYGQYGSARDIYIVMRETGLQPDYELAELMVEVFVKIGQVQEAQNLLKEIVDAGINPSKRMVATVVEAGGTVAAPGDSGS